MNRNQHWQSQNGDGESCHSEARRLVDRLITRRQLLGRSATGLGLAALGSLLGKQLGAAQAAKTTGWGRAKRVIFLTQSGAPSQMDLFDYKPSLEKHRGTELPDSVRMGQRLTSMTADQEEKLLVPSQFKFARHGESGRWVSELLPHTAAIADELCFVYSMHTHAINHDPAINFLQTGSEKPGRPSMGAWLSYGLGNENEQLPSYAVFVSGGRSGDQPLYDRLWGAGFLPTQHQAVRFRGGSEPILFLKNPNGIDRHTRRLMLDLNRELHQLQSESFSDPRIADRVGHFEMAYQLQMSAPELADLSSEPEHVLRQYGPEVTNPGSFAYNCIMARRLAERGVRFVQLFHRGWDHHADLPSRIKEKCQETDQPSAALVRDLRERGMLDDTLVVWAGEFGRTSFCQGKLTAENYGRDHHPRCFTAWLAGGGFRRGIGYGATDEFSYRIAENPVHVHDLHATMLHALGIDHEQLTFRSEGRDYRLTDVFGEVVHDLL
jgi:uncharacterized protein (DUF1501 family)